MSSESAAMEGVKEATACVASGITITNDVLIAIEKQMTRIEATMQVAVILGLLRTEELRAGRAITDKEARATGPRVRKMLALTLDGMEAEKKERG